MFLSCSLPKQVIVQLCSAATFQRMGMEGGEFRAQNLIYTGNLLKGIALFTYYVYIDNSHKDV